MSGLVLAAAVLVASLALTYFFCLRPMRRGRCAMAPKAQADGHFAAPVDREAEITRLRDEIAALHAATPTRESR
ncbi:hypothetical protein DC347_18080 [Pseudarthrobacter sp. AG30]|uniref:hypothetical protein n=1 Tax=Pseudarthrobacter sp. AG30 TaxID=2249742 RepID=UPI000D6E8119|nr:hypothetical protein [Pseudarthrobacter sp. AG30]RAX15283.1 hypothetical protein DC347_18080 [Pseudarthrobacter sp. AG30]